MSDISKSSLAEIVFLVVFYLIIISFCIGGVVIYNDNNDNKEVINEYCEEKEVVQKQLRQINDNYEYRIYFDNDDFVTIGEKLYDKIEVGDKIIVEYKRFGVDDVEVAGVGLCDE